VVHFLTANDTQPVPIESIRWGAVARILFGVTNDGGGLAIGPGGQPIPINPWGPLRSSLSSETQDVLLALAVTELASMVQSSDSRAELRESSARLMGKAMERMMRSAIR